MNALSINIAAQSLFSRFLWKEYRMLRGFWLAVFVIAFVIQWFFSTDILYTGSFSNVVFFISWSAAALYSVGAAITLFAAETEERTREYLRLLPGDWKPMFAAKIALATLSILLLGLALSLTGAWLEGWTTSQDARLTLGVAGVAAVEGLCWGLLFSLWWRQPLFAAIAAMACGSLGAQLAISFGSNSQESWTAQAYANAAPARLLICLGLFAGAVLLGRRWFYPQLTNSNALAERNGSTVRALPLTQIKSLPRTKMLSRLLWQTWRESWKSMLAGLVLGSVLTVVLAGFADFISELHNYSLACVGLITPALLGSLVFRPDQQRDHRLFIATHAIPPRRMWLARQIVWLALVVVSVVIINTFTSWFFNLNIQNSLSLYLRGEWGYTELLGREFENSDSPWTQWWRFEHARELFSRAVLTAWCAVIAAYGVGQLCSMLLRQSLLAGFLAILLSIVIGAWSLLMFFWQMPSLVFVLPVGLAALLATWLRTPSWVIGRNTVRSWLAPALVLSLPFFCFVLTIPAVRNSQVYQPSPDFPFLKEPFAQMVGKYSDQDSSRQKLINEVNQLATSILWPHVLEVTIEGKSLDELGISEHKFDSYRDDAGMSVSDEDGKMIDRFHAELRRLRAERNQETIKKIMALTERPSFSQILDTQHMSTLAGLLRDDAARLTTEGDLADAWQRLKALARFDEWFQYQQLPYLNAILNWAQYTDQTSDQLKRAISDLHETFQSLPLPSERILGGYVQSREMILETEPPYESVPPSTFLSNRLPGERERGLVALDYLTVQQLNYANAVVHLSRGGTARTGLPYRDARQMVDNPRELVRHAPWSGVYAIHQIAFNGSWRDFVLANRITDSAASSFFAASIVQQSGHLRGQLLHWVDAETRRRATLIQLALLAYHIDHDEYPESLDDLKDYWPTMLPWNINDPYSNKPFKYRQHGLEHALKLPVQKLIPAKTPLLWSVGSGNWIPREIFEYDPNQPVKDSKLSHGQTVYEFIPQETYNNLVFQMPVFPKQRLGIKKGTGFGQD